MKKRIKKYAQVIDENTGRTGIVTKTHKDTAWVSWTPTKIKTRNTDERMKKSDLIPVYPDTAKGAIQYLSDDSCHDTAGAEAVADPAVEGVWKVILKADRVTEYAIVYLAGYKEPFGQLRSDNDFESCDRDRPLPARPTKKAIDGVKAAAVISKKEWKKEYLPEFNETRHDGLSRDEVVDALRKLIGFEVRSTDGCYWYEVKTDGVYHDGERCEGSIWAGLTGWVASKAEVSDLIDELDAMYSDEMEKAPVAAITRVLEMVGMS